MQHAAAGQRPLRHPRQAAAAQLRAPDTVVGDLDAQLLAVTVDADADVPRAGVLDRVGHRLTSQIERRRL